MQAVNCMISVFSYILFYPLLLLVIYLQKVTCYQKYLSVVLYVASMLFFMLTEFPDSCSERKSVGCCLSHVYGHSSYR